MANNRISSDYTMGTMKLVKHYSSFSVTHAKIDTFGI